MHAVSVFGCVILEALRGFCSHLTVVIGILYSLSRRRRCHSTMQEPFCSVAH